MLGRFIQKTLRAHIVSLVILFVVVVALAALNVLNAAALKLLIDIATGESGVHIAYGIVFPIAVSILAAALNGLQSCLSTKTRCRIKLSLRTSLLDRVERIPMRILNGYHSGDFMTRIFDDTELASRMLPGTIISLCAGALSCVFALCFLFYLSWKMAILAIVLTPMVILWSKRLLPKIQSLAEKTRDAESDTRSYIQEQLSTIPMIKSANNYSYSVSVMSELLKKLNHVDIVRTIHAAVMEGGASVIGFLSFVGTVGLGIFLVRGNEITVGTVIGFIQMLNYIVWPFTEMMRIISDAQTEIAAVKRLNELRDHPVEAESAPRMALASSFSLSFENVSFAYGDTPVVSNFTHSFQSGQTVGIIGKSGCGKSTLINLILAIYAPNSGSITLKTDAGNIDDIDIRRYIGYVPQDHVIQSGSIEANIRYGFEASTGDALEAAARKANIHDFIVSLPDGYKTEIRGNAENLSFGQAQRISVARALLRDAPILIMDEPTASVDEESRAVIMKTICQRDDRKLCFVVSHSENDHSYFDKIIRFSDNSIDVLEGS